MHNRDREETIRKSETHTRRQMKETKCTHTKVAAAAKVCIPLQSFAALVAESHRNAYVVAGTLASARA